MMAGSIVLRLQAATCACSTGCKKLFPRPTCNRSAQRRCEWAGSGRVQHAARGGAGSDTLSARCRAAASTTATADLDDMCPLQDCKSTLDFPLVLPVLTFTPSECLAPSGIKTLHFWEPKDLDMLDQVMQHAAASGTPPCLVHTTIEMGTPMACASSIPGALVTPGGILFLSTLVQVLRCDRGPRGGVQVTVRGEGRVRIARLRSVEPFITGEVWPLQDVLPPALLRAQRLTAPPEACATSAPAQGAEARERNSAGTQALGPGLGQPWGTQHAGKGDGLAEQAQEGGGEDHGSCGYAPVGEALTALLTAGSPAEAGGQLLAAVEELRVIVQDICDLLHKLDRPVDAQRLLDALHWASDAPPVMCNLATTHDSAQLYCLQDWRADDVSPGAGASMSGDSGGQMSSEQHVWSDSSWACGLAAATATPYPPSSHDLAGLAQGTQQAAVYQGQHHTPADQQDPPVVSTYGYQQGSPAAESAGPVAGLPVVPCLISHVDRVTRMSFALLHVLPDSTEPSAWSAGSVLRSALSHLDTRDRLALVAQCCVEARARLAARVSLTRVRHPLP